MKQSKNTQRRKSFQEAQTSFSECSKYRIFLDPQSTPWEKGFWVSQNHLLTNFKKCMPKKRLDAALALSIDNTTQSKKEIRVPKKM